MSQEDWSSPSFHDSARRWVEQVCRSHGVEITGELEQPHCRPWSSAIRFETLDEPVWFKVNGPGTRHEGSLVAVLARLEPGLVPDILGVDQERGWSLTRDAGPMLRTFAPPDDLWPHWEGVLRRYAEAQIRIAEHTGELLAVGVPEVSPLTLPALAEELVDRLGQIDPAEGGLTAEERRALRERLPEYTGWCAELAASGIPSSVQHDDLHSSNIGWRGSVETAQILDWGDATVGFPLGTMLCTLNSIGYHAQAELDDPRVTRVRDAYLEPFEAFAAHDELVRYVGLARQVGCVTRALSYQAALAGGPPTVHADNDFPVRGWLMEMLEPAPA